MRGRITKGLHSVKSHYSAKTVNFQSYSLFKFFSGLSVGASATLSIVAWPSIAIYMTSPVVAIISAIEDQEIVSNYNKNLETIADKRTSVGHNVPRSELDVAVTNVITSSAEFGAGVYIGYVGGSVFNNILNQYF